VQHLPAGTAATEKEPYDTRMQSPFGPMMAVRDEVHRLFHENFGQVRGDGATEVTGTWEPPVDIYGTDDALVLRNSGSVRCTTC
jgi:hypothetical protein